MGIFGYQTMSRPLRIEYPDAWYHVMNRANHGHRASVAVHWFKGSEVQGYVLVPGPHFEGVFL